MNALVTAIMRRGNFISEVQAGARRWGEEVGKSGNFFKFDS